MKRTIESQWPNAGYIEFHENHYETSVEDSPSFETWFTNRLLRLTTSGNHAQAHILTQCRFKILEYSIQQTSMGYELAEYQLIHRCEQLFTSYCWQLRIS